MKQACGLSKEYYDELLHIYPEWRTLSEMIGPSRTKDMILNVLNHDRYFKQQAAEQQTKGGEQ